MFLGMYEENVRTGLGTSEKGTDFLQIVATENFFLLKPIHSIGNKDTLKAG